MTDIYELHRKLVEAYETFEAYSMCNTADGKSDKELVDLAIGYRKACWAYQEAFWAYEAALDAEASR